MYFSPDNCVSNSLNRFGLYELHDFSTYEQDLRNNYSRVIKPMLANAQQSNEEEQPIHVFNEPANPKDVQINDLIKKEPKTIEEFIEIMNSRLTTVSNSCLEELDQQELIKICIQEAKFKWKEMKRVIEDPYLNHQENMELRRRLFINVISICEKLFKHYSDKAEILKSRQVFSYSANFSRLKTLMACDLSKFLNIHLLKHHLADFLKNNQRITSGTTQHSKSFTHLNMRRVTTRDLIEDFGSQHGKSKRFKTTKEHIRELQENMPVLETKQIARLLKSLPQIKKIDQVETAKEVNDNTNEDGAYETNINSENLLGDEILLERLKDTTNKLVCKKKRSKSISYFHELGLLEELNLNISTIINEKYKTTDSLKLFEHTRKNKNHDKSKRKLIFSDLVKYNDKQLAFRLKQDLDNLTIEMRRKESIREHEDDYLLMTLMSKPGLKERMKEIKAKVKAIDKRYKKFMEEIKLPINEEKMEIVQPATIETSFLNNFPIRLSDIRVTNRVLRYNITIKPFGPLYNDIQGEIDSMMVQHLDRNLYIGGEVKEVYDELIKTISEDHLRFDLDDYVQKAPNALRYESSYTSSLLVKFGKTKSINNALVKNESPPWGKKNFREWNKTFMNSYFYRDDKLKSPLIDPDFDLENNESVTKKSNGKKIPPDVKPMDIKPEKIELYKHCDPTEFKNKEFNVWLRWWKTYLSSDDYIKYLTTQTSDYLGLIFHLYDQDENPILFQTDEEVKLMDEKEKAEKERVELIDTLKQQKYNYEPGLWNPDSIFLGGLGKDPVLDKTEDPILKFKQNLENSRPKSYKIHFFKGDREEKNEEEEARNKMLENLKEKKSESPQQRLERVWTLLRMSDTAKLDMAIKYCTSTYADKLIEAIEDWETATNLIAEREKYIYELESFERFASDPNRFFMKGNRGSSAARLEEALKRENLYKQIEILQTKIEAILKIIEKKYRDVITYNERPYLDKMKWDRIEMLHWLTEERRKKYFKNETRNRQLKTSLIEI